MGQFEIALFKSWNNSTNTSPSLSLYPLKGSSHSSVGQSPSKQMEVLAPHIPTHSLLVIRDRDGTLHGGMNEWMDELSVVS